MANGTVSPCKISPKHAQTRRLVLGVVLDLADGVQLDEVGSFWDSPHKQLLGAKGIATRSKDATRGS